MRRLSCLLFLYFGMNPLAFLTPRLVRTATPVRYFGKRMRRNSVIIDHGKPVRVRFAPSPTGSLHVGGARTALFNWLKARGSGGTYIVRIEDTDLARSTPESERSMLADLSWLGLDWDEGPGVEGSFGPYRQSQRSDHYQAMAQKLLDSGAAYRCFTPEADLKMKREEGSSSSFDFSSEWRNADPKLIEEKLKLGVPHTVRFKVQPGSGVAIQDIVRGKVSWDAEATLNSDFVLLRSSGIPVYNFCVAVDDALMGITHVIRAEEHLTNTLRQGLILKALGYQMPQYAHASLILGEDRSKLSKRHGATSILQFRQQGFLKEAMINYLAALGWNDGTEKEIFSIDELINAFRLDRIVKAPSMFDMAKLRWVNGQHLRALDPAKLQPLLKPFILESGMLSSDEMSDKFLEMSVLVSCDKIEVLVDALPILKKVLSYPLLDTIAQDETSRAIIEDKFDEVAEVVIRAWEEKELPDGTSPEFDAQWKLFVKKVGTVTGRKGKRLFHPLRLALTGSMHGPDIGSQIKFLASAVDQVPAKSLVELSDRIRQLRELACQKK